MSAARPEAAIRVACSQQKCGTDGSVAVLEIECIVRDAAGATSVATSGPVPITEDEHLAQAGSGRYGDVRRSIVRTRLESARQVARVKLPVRKQREELLRRIAEVNSEIDELCDAHQLPRRWDGEILIDRPRYDPIAWLLAVGLCAAVVAFGLTLVV